MNDRLKQYEGKRDFRRTNEPKAGAAGGGPSGPPRFVIQEHQASSHHYDLRLEVAGVLVSWAVPKGPSTDPREKRLAIRTEDHPLEYRDFEGVIPEDQYGGGAVIVWDRGPYRNLKEDDEGNEVPLEDQVEGGHVTVRLDGEKLQGGFSLKRIGREGDQEKWLLVKMKDEGADARRNPVNTQRESVRSGRTVEEVAEEEADEGEAQ